MGKAEKASLLKFMESQAHLLQGEVLDFGCGLQPYRHLVGEQASYHGFDRITFPGSTVAKDVGVEWPLHTLGRYDSIMCNQVIQFFTHPDDMLRNFCQALKPDGWLVLTGPTNWPEEEVGDIYRFTINGIGYLLSLAGFVDITVLGREVLQHNDIMLSLGWGATARRA
jgi:SAM-dependent methyltransferase